MLYGTYLALTVIANGLRIIDIRGNLKKRPAEKRSDLTIMMSIAGSA